MIAKEGFKVLLILFIFSSLFILLRIHFVGTLSILLFLFTLFFLRDPKRTPPTEDNIIVSPADGKITEIVINDAKIEVSIFMSITDVHVNRVPLDGEVLSIERRGAKFMRAFLKEADFHNVQCETKIVSPKIGEYSVIQISGIIARRIINNLKPGQQVKTGERMGIILYGSKVKVILPTDKVEILVKEGQHVKAGITILGKIRR